MSANNWGRCPRCTAQKSRRLEAREAEVQQLYGTVSVQEFDKARQMLDEEMKEFEHRPANFREDYEIYGAEDGTVTVDYAGSCQDCGLRLSFKDDHVIPDWNKS